MERVPTSSAIPLHKILTNQSVYMYLVLPSTTPSIATCGKMLGFIGTITLCTKVFNHDKNLPNKFRITDQLFFHLKKANYLDAQTDSTCLKQLPSIPHSNNTHML